MDELCHFIRENGLEPPPMPNEKDTTLRKILDTLAIPSPNDPRSNKAKENLNEYQLPESTSATYVASVEGHGGTDSELNQQTTSTIDVPGASMMNHCLSDPVVPPISQQNSSSLTFEDENSVFTGESPDMIPNGWFYDLDLGAHATASAFDPKEQQADVPTMIDLEAIGPFGSECDSIFTEDQGAISDIEALVDEISDRLGTVKISNSGKTRFYGPTSTFNLREIPFVDSYEADCLSPSYNSEPEEEIPPSLEEHLMDLYFSWQDPLFHVVDRGIYEGAKEKWKNLEETPFYSDALRNAM